MAVSTASLYWPQLRSTVMFSTASAALGTGAPHAMPHSAAAVQAESQGGVQSVRENHRILPIETMLF